MRLMNGVNGTINVFSNGRILLLVILAGALAGVTVLAILHDMDAQAVTAIYTAVIAGAIGHANGNLQGRLSAERERLLAEANRPITKV